MTQLIIYIPALIILYLVYRSSIGEALVRVYLPCLMLVPLSLRFFIKGIDLSSVSTASLLLATVGVWLGIKDRTFKWNPVDIAVLLYSFGSFYADAHYRKLTLGIYAGASTFLSSACPYFIGRTLIEARGERVRVARALVFCMAVVAIVSVWEFRMTSNPFQNFADRLNDLPAGWGRQVRWGFARVAGPYGSAIMAGAMFSCGLALQVWLMGAKRWTGWWGERYLKGRYCAIAVLAALLLGCLMTQSRGPWIGCALGLIVACVGVARNVKLAAIVASLVLCIGLSVTYTVLDNYTKGDYHNAQDIDQQNAGYRRELIKTYMPIVEKGGIWGWGRPFQLTDTGMGSFVDNQPSIDNEYLLVLVGVGYFGFTAFLFILLGTLSRLVSMCIKLSSRDDRMFAFALLGLVAGLAFTLSTVFLGEPVCQLFFLCCGWSWSLRPQWSLRTVPIAEPFSFSRVFA